MTGKLILAEIWLFIKLNFKWMLLVVLILILFSRGCFNSFMPQKATSDTTTRVIQVPQPIIINPPYQPAQSGATIYVPVPGNSQPVTPATDIAGLTQQVILLNSRIENLAKEYYAIKHYEDSIPLHDTSGLRVGVVNLKQTVSENTLKSTQPSYQLTFPHTITTINNYAVPRNQVYIGGGFNTGLKGTGFSQVNLGLQFKNKTNHMFGAALGYDLQSKQTGLNITYYKLITIKKPSLTSLLK